MADCTSLAGLLNESFLTGVGNCLDDNRAIADCMLEGVRMTTPTDAHRDFADAFCEGCVALGTDRCKSAFFDEESEDTGLAATLVTPLGDGITARLKEECTSGVTCLAEFPSCAQRTLIEEGVPEQTVGCFLDQLRKADPKPPMCTDFGRDGGVEDAGFDAGLDAAGLDAAGLDAAGLDAAGLDAAGLDGGHDAGCSDGLDECGGSCVDTSTNPDHCGVCDRACPGDGRCEEGVCVDECSASEDCPPGETCDAGRCVDDGCSETFEPNDLRSDAHDLGSITDRTSYPAGRTTSVLSGASDEDWYAYHVDDNIGGRVRPRVERVSGSVEICAFWACSDGRDGSISCASGSSETVDGLSGCCDASNIVIEPDCPGLDDGGTVWIRADRASSACEEYRFDWGDD